MTDIQHNFEIPKNNKFNYNNPTRAKLYNNIGMTGTYEVTYNKIKSICGSLYGQNWLDFGCGPGRSTSFLNTLGASVIGVDNCSEMIKLAKNFFPRFQFHLCGNGHDNNLGLFDGALSAFVFLEMSSKAEMNEALLFISNHLKSGAPFILATINPFSVGKKFSSWQHDGNPENLESGQPIYCIINSTTKFIVQDYYWKIEDYKNVLSENDFIVDDDDILMNKKEKSHYIDLSAPADENDAWLIITSRKN